MALPAFRATIFIAAALVLASCDTGAPVPAGSTGAATPAPSDGSPAPVASPVALVAHTGAPAGKGGNCALDFVNAGALADTSVVTGSKVNMVGWVASPQNTVPSDAMVMLTGTGGNYSGALPVGGDRPDVAAAMGSENARMSGFSALVSLTDVAPGSYAISVVQGGASPVSCAFNKNLVVAAGG